MSATKEKSIGKTRLSTELFKQSHKRRIEARSKFESPEVQTLVELACKDAYQQALDDSGEKLSTIEIGIVGGDGSFRPAGWKKSGAYNVPGLSSEKSGYATTTVMKSSGLGPTTNPDVGKSQQLTQDSVEGLFFDRDGVLEAPWNLTLLQELMLINVIHAAAIETKAADYAYSGWELKRSAEAQALIDTNKLSEEEVDEAKIVVTQFLNTCFDGGPVEDMCRDFALQYEALGTAAVEVIRTRGGLIYALDMIPFHTVRFLNQKRREKTGATYLQRRFENKKRFFVALNDTVEYPQNEDFDPLRAPILDFPQGVESTKSFIQLKKKGLVNAQTGAPEAKWEKAATELFHLARRPLTVSEFYGTPAGIQAHSSILAMKRIDDYNLQFFANKGVPQYAITIEGLTAPKATLAGTTGTLQNTPDRVAEMRNTIHEFFEHKLTAANRSVLVSTTFGDAKIKFDKLSAESIEASFAEYEDRMKEMIRLSHRIPGPAMGILETANLGGGRDTAQMTRYRDHIVVPSQRQLATLVNKIVRSGLLIPYFDFHFKAIDLNEEETLREFMLKSFIAGGISLDELRPHFPGMLEEIGEENGGKAFFIRHPSPTVVNQNLDSQEVAMMLQINKMRKKMGMVTDALKDALDEEATIQEGDKVDNEGATEELILTQ